MAVNSELFINRELSWLAFNARVLNEAFDARNPLLERLKFLSIFSTNLDEFYMVRVAGLRRQLLAGVTAATGPDGMTPAELVSAIRARILELVERQQHCLHDILLPALEGQGVRLVTMSELSAGEWQTVDDFFESDIFPVLTPLAVDPTHPFPYISNLSLSLAVQLYDPDNKVERFARVKIPKSLPRWVGVGRANHFVPVEQVISANLGALFPGMEILGSWAFRVTRYSDLEVKASDETEDLLTAIEEQVFQRRFTEVVRVEVQTGVPDEIRAILVDELREEQTPEFALTPEDVVDGGSLLELGDLMALATLDIPELRDPPFAPVTPVRLRDTTRSIFDVIKERDLLVHHPYESFTASVEQFVQAAALDPDVLAIKMTLYRTSGDTPIVRALTDAAERGKQVAVLVELQARFDEANNITWARTLEDYGVHVAYGLPGLKTHAKTTLVVRREPDGIRRYVHVGTGNYNSKTARLYTDLGLFTVSRSIGADITDLFNALTGFSRQRLYRKILVAPANMRDRLMDMIRRETALASAGKSGRIIAKMNSIVDEQIIEALYDASRAGVEIDLIVRGICCLRPGVPGASDNIRVMSVIGRFLEHSRLFYFANDTEPEYYIGSADWMTRNFDRRVEAIVPVDDVLLHEKLYAILRTSLEDNREAWDLASDGSYTQRNPGTGPVRATQEIFLRDPWGGAPPELRLEDARVVHASRRG
ncbi:MAG TPA: polyphosphate kinase 1 [Gemmatimonadaceae bacterium]|nr:polyphosphate kinase 1 [Gemmatimonadaceae bacterium]